MLSEVLVRFTRAGFGPAAITADDQEARVHLAYPVFDPAQGTVSGLYTLAAARPTMGLLAEAVEAAYPRHRRFGPGDEGPTATYLVHVNGTGNGKARGPPERFTLEAFPDGTVLGPGTLADGAFHLRAVVPGPVDLERVLAARDKALKSGGWTHFQLERTGTFDAARAAAGALAAEMTPKQLEVLRSAVALGYYESPRKITLDDLAEVFGISKAAIHNRLQAAERKIITGYLG